MHLLFLSVRLSIIYDLHQRAFAFKKAFVVCFFVSRISHQELDRLCWLKKRLPVGSLAFAVEDHDVAIYIALYIWLTWLISFSVHRLFIKLCSWFLASLCHCICLVYTEQKHLSKIK